MDASKAGLNKPGGAAPAADEPVINVIPDRFYMAGLKKKVKAEPPKQAAIVPPSPGGAAPGAPAAPPAKKKGGKGLVIVFALLALLLVGGGGAAIFFLMNQKPVTPTPNANTVVTPPAPVGPTCGDGKCDATESSDTCSADCKAVTPPAPVGPTCGDGKCDATESSDTCATDCQAPVPLPTTPTCGDNRCEGEESAQSCPADCKPSFGQDTDNDGVSDIEETQIYGINQNDPDSDKDSYLDLNEIVNLFDPANSAATAQLKTNVGIAQYDGTAPDFSVLYPKPWTVQPGDATTGGVFFKAPSGEFIQVFISDKPATQNLMDWFLEQNPSVKSSDVQSLKTKQGNDGVLSPDRMTAYVGAGDKVYVVSYDLGNQTNVNFRATFQMMIRSLMVK